MSVAFTGCSFCTNANDLAAKCKVYLGNDLICVERRRKTLHSHLFAVGLVWFNVHVVFHITI